MELRAINIRPWKRRLLLGALCVAMVVGAAWGARWLSYRCTHSISKDAFVESHLIEVAPQAAGTLVEVYVQEQDRVRKGQLLAVVDPSTYQREVELATARLHVAEASLQKAVADLDLLTQTVPKRVTVAEMKLAIAREDEAKAVESLAMISRDVDEGVNAARHTVEGARAAVALAEEDYNRYTALYRVGSVTQRRSQEATRTHGVARAELQVAEARLGQAEANRKQTAIADQQLKAAQHAVAEAQAELALARLGALEIVAGQKLVAERERAAAEARRSLDLAKTNLGYARIEAPFPGVIARKWRHRGDYAHVGDAVLSMYNPNLLYVTVNLEETLLEGVAPGNFADLYVDAFRAPFRGRVIWVGSATSANFSLIPRDISSGEFTYVVQRVPTRIAIERDDRWPFLRPGLSVTAAIEHGTGDPEWARKASRQEAKIEEIMGKHP